MKKFNLKDFNSMVDFREYEPLSPMEAIKAHCRECYCWDIKEMKQCDTYSCPFNQFLRNGFKSFRGKYNISEEERNRRRELGKSKNKHF